MFENFYSLQRRPLLVVGASFVASFVTLILVGAAFGLSDGRIGNDVFAEETSFITPPAMVTPGVVVGAPWEDVKDTYTDAEDGTPKGDVTEVWWDNLIRNYTPIFGIFDFFSGESIPEVDFEDSLMLCPAENPFDTLRCVVAHEKNCHPNSTCRGIAGLVETLVDGDHLDFDNVDVDSRALAMLFEDGSGHIVNVITITDSGTEYEYVYDGITASKKFFPNNDAAVNLRQDQLDDNETPTLAGFPN